MNEANSVPLSCSKNPAHRRKRRRRRCSARHTTRRPFCFSSSSLILLLLIIQQSTIVSNAQTSNCRSYDYDCNGCLENGCWWCGVDAICTRSAFVNNLFSACRQASDFTQDTCNTQQDRLIAFNDPLIHSQEWFLNMMKVPEAWKLGYTGKNVRVRINDSGIDALHEEFKGRFDRLASCSKYIASDSNHGTSVASIVGAAADNGECGVGIAPNVVLSSCNIFQEDGDAFLGDDKLSRYDISQNSFGYPSCGTGRRRRAEQKLRKLTQQSSKPIWRNLQTSQKCPFQYIHPDYASPCQVCDFPFVEGTTCLATIDTHCKLFFEQDKEACIDYLYVYLPGNDCNYNTLTFTAKNAIERGITEGRDGKGLLYIFAAGNSYFYGDDTNMKGFTNTRYTISVGSVGKDGLHASYSTPGAGLIVSAPGGDHENYTNHVGARVNGGCSNAGVGTSFACPLVSGVVALMLEARPELTWRDVQGILATTSKILVDDPRDLTRVTNSAGLEHSHKYGFGVVNAEAAVRGAEEWELYAPELSHTVVYDTEFLVPTDGTPVSINLQVPELLDGYQYNHELNSIEAIVIELRMEHFSRGDLKITLSSPSNVPSILHPGKRPENLILDIEDEEDVWELLTVRNYGEEPNGEWTLEFEDLLPNADSNTCADYPFEIVFSDGFELNCNYLRQMQYCVGGTLNPDYESSETVQFILSLKDNGMDVLEACCECGGGFGTDEFEDKVYQIKMTIFGRDATVTPMPSTSPTKTPTKFPTKSPTRMPSASPTGAPSSSPTETLSDTPSQVPSASPSSSSPTETSEPTATPEPSPNPSISMQPTKIPSTFPTGAPSMTPSLYPTTQDPTVAPTDNQVVTVTKSPTRSPSSMPSSVPSTPPSLMPSSVPSVSPSTRSPQGQSPSTTSQAQNPSSGSPQGQSADIELTPFAITMNSNTIEGVVRDNLENYLEQEVSDALAVGTENIDIALSLDDRQRRRLEERNGVILRYTGTASIAGVPLQENVQRVQAESLEDIESLQSYLSEASIFEITVFEVQVADRAPVSASACVGTTGNDTCGGDGDGDDNNTAAIIGGVVGGVVLFAIVVVGVLCYRKKYQAAGNPKIDLAPEVGDAATATSDDLYAFAGDSAPAQQASVLGVIPRQDYFEDEPMEGNIDDIKTKADTPTHYSFVPESTLEQEPGPGGDYFLDEDEAEAESLLKSSDHLSC